MPIAKREPEWIPRKEAAKILGTSYWNVCRLQKIGKLTKRNEDQNGTVLLERREVLALAAERQREAEALARRRGGASPPVTYDGELTARVFEMFEKNRSFAQIVIETKRDAKTIRELREDYDRGFAARMTRAESEAQKAAEEAERLERERGQRDIDDDIARLKQRRREVFGAARADATSEEDEGPPSSWAPGRKKTGT